MVVSEPAVASSEELPRRFPVDQLLRIIRLLSRSPAGLYWLLGRLPRNKQGRKRLVLGIVSLLLIGGITAELTLAPRHLPWHPLAIDDRAGFSTDLKLAAISLGPESWCDRLVDGSTVLETASLDAHDGDGSCGWESAYHLASSNGVTLKGNSPYAMRCPLAAGAHIWLTSVDYHARQMLGSAVVRIHHAGTYSCRRMNNRSTGPMSQHAYANAWDVTGFELADGRVVSIEKHWNDNGPFRAFLRAARDDACNIFRVVLGPEFNAQHHDHLHVDMGNGSRCR